MVEIGRLITAMITPFDEKGDVNYNEAKRLALALVDSGSDGLVITGTTGESPVLSTEEKLRLYSEIKQAVGDRADLLVGTHGQFTPAGAIRLAKRLEPYDPLWFEEPVPPEAPEQMAKVARATSIPIATGERLTTK